MNLYCPIDLFFIYLRNGNVIRTLVNINTKQTIY